MCSDRVVVVSNVDVDIAVVPESYSFLLRSSSVQVLRFVIGDVTALQLGN